MELWSTSWVKHGGLAIFQPCRYAVIGSDIAHIIILEMVRVAVDYEGEEAGHELA